MRLVSRINQIDNIMQHHINSEKINPFWQKNCNALSKYTLFCVCYVIVFIVSYREITNSRFSLTQSKPYIFLVSGPNKSNKERLKYQLTFHHEAWIRKCISCKLITITITERGGVCCSRNLNNLTACLRIYSISLLSY